MPASSCTGEPSAGTWSEYDSFTPSCSGTEGEATATVTEPQPPALGAGALLLKMRALVLSKACCSSAGACPAGYSNLNAVLSIARVDDPKSMLEGAGQMDGAGALGGGDSARINSVVPSEIEAHSAEQQFLRYPSAGARAASKVPNVQLAEVWRGSTTRPCMPIDTIKRLTVVEPTAIRLLRAGGFKILYRAIDLLDVMKWSCGNRIRDIHTQLPRF